MLKNYNEITQNYNKNFKIKSNYHTHNYLCGHASGTVCDYVKAAVDNGMELIGISDHFKSPAASSSPYLNIETLNTKYLPQFASAQEIYGRKIKILRGAEMEFFSGYDELYKELSESLDYLVLGQHEYLSDGVRRDAFICGTDEDNVLAYIKAVTDGIKSGYFAIVAHPDLIFYNNPPITEKISSKFEELVLEAVKNGVALELNANGIRSHGFRYPTDILVSLLKKYNAKTVVSSDCHSPEFICDEYVLRLYDYALKEKLNVSDEIKLFGH